MYISLNWLRTYLNLENLDINVLKNRLILSGFEIEEILIKTYKNKKDIIFDVSTTANRSDVLSLLGFATEASNLFSLERKRFPYNYTNNYCLSPTTEIKTDFFGTIAYLGVVVENIQYETKSPIWLKSRLLNLNLTDIDLFSNLANYTMLEWGQPIQLYDYEKIKTLTGNNSDFVIKTRFAKQNENFIDSENRSYSLSPLTLLVVVNDFPISIAGGPVSMTASIDKTTKSLFVETAIFSPRVFRQSMKNVGIRTNSTLFYERRVNEFLLNSSCKRFLNLLCLFNKDIKYKPLITFLEKTQNKFEAIKLDCNNLKTVLGLEKFIRQQAVMPNQISKNLSSLEQNITKSTESFVIKVIKKLDFQVYEKSKNIFFIKVPFTRYIDIEEEIDLLEEIGRFVGFNKFSTIFPKKSEFGKLSRSENLKRKFRKSLLNLGFSEVFNYSLVPVKNFQKSASSSSKVLDYELRNTLLNQILENNYTNLKKGNLPIQAFEFGRIFVENNKDFILEYEAIGGIFGGLKWRSDWSLKSSNTDWFQAKGIFEILLTKLSLRVNFSVPELIPNIAHRKRVLTIKYERKKIGNFFEINPKFVNKNGFVKNVYLFELNFTKILKLIEKRKKTIYYPYSIYPVSKVDLSLIVPNNLNFMTISKTILSSANNCLKSFELFDIYKNLNVTSNTYNLGVTLKFQSKEGTLTRTEVESVVLDIKSKLMKELNILVRD